MAALRRNPTFWLITSLIALGLVTFWPSLQFDYVNWDDPSYIWFNELITSWSFSHLYGIATETVTRNYAPLTILSYLIDHTFWGGNPGGYHFTNIVLHAINGALVFVLLRQLTGSRMIGWTTAALFLVHPVQLETVVWISSRKGLLSAAFMLAAMIVYTRPVAGKTDQGWYLGWLAAALLSKALAVVLPPILMLYDILVRGRTVRQALVRQFIPGLLSLLLMLHTMGAQNTVLGGVRGHMSLPLWRILAVDMTILSRYIGMLFWPSDLCVLYDPPTSGIAVSVILSVFAWGSAVLLIWQQRSRTPLLMFALGTFLLLLFPVLNFFRITTLMNDRYLYLPCVAVFAVTAAGLERAARALIHWRSRHSDGTKADVRTSFLRLFSPAVAVAATSVLIGITQARMPVWRDSLALWSDARISAPQLCVVRIQMALTLQERGHTEEAIRELLSALRDCNPDQGDEQRIQAMLNEWAMAILQEHGRSSATSRIARDQRDHVQR
ncbi:MAG: hypothetical protein KDA96_04515 [Planctomycetaceae bacterium]|nr:hypothetical protein [Planctomycetaceae bacterium]